MLSAHIMVLRAVYMSMRGLVICPPHLRLAQRCQIRRSDEPLPTDPFPIGLAGARVSREGVEEVTIVLHLLAIGGGLDRQLA
jgi:hypothetical protein